MASRSSRPTALLVSVLMLTALLGTAQSGWAGTSGPYSRTDSGYVHGKTVSGVEQFLGVPFAAPPVGRLRWRPPAAVSSWTGVREATRPGPQCAQTYGLPLTTNTNEDCLYLNVYVPSGGAASKPVMVWIHGGAYAFGAGDQYDPTELAKAGDVVVVTINYRLGPFGFLAHPALSAEAADHSSGDYGLMDQQAALRWVQRNAPAFGGDPRSVTIFGESAGAGSVCAQVASPWTAGMFARAIAESGCTLPSPALPDAERHGVEFATALGCGGGDVGVAACLRSRSAAALLASSGINVTKPDLDWAPAVGGSILPRPVQVAFEQGDYQRVPVLAGTNHDEGTFFVAAQYLLGLGVASWNYDQLIARTYGSRFVARVLARYPLTDYPGAAQALAAVITDSMFACPAYAFGRALAKTTSTYVYEFDDPAAAMAIPLPTTFPTRAAHTSELAYVFGRTVALKLTPLFSPAQYALSRTMMGYWTSFARSGTPNTAGAAWWAPVTEGQYVVQHLRPDSVGPRMWSGADHNCGFWQELVDDGLIPAL